MGTSNAEHPMQPLVMDGNVVRFKRNAIVDRLFNEGVINLNRIAMWLDSVPVEDVEQFWQLLGYSVSGYGDLSFIRPETVAKADELAAEMVKQAKESAASKDNVG